MSRTSLQASLQMQCPHPECLHEQNALGKRVCDRCQGALSYRYLWAIGESVPQNPLGMLVEQRYVVMSPHIWLDTKPAVDPNVPFFPEEVLPYLHLYPQRLHVPGVYGFCGTQDDAPVMLLDNAPIDAAGQLYPTLASVWAVAPAVRQVYWLWQMLQLWTPLRQQGVATSLLMPDNLRVEGWRVCLRELIPDPLPPRLKDLADCWLPWVDHAQPQVTDALQAFMQDLQFAEATQADLVAFGIVAATAPEGYVPITLNAQLNQILLEQSAQQPFRLETAGATTTGPQRDHNEDSCFPVSPMQDALLPQVAIICDGIGGHEGGEVASQLALSSLKIQVGALMHEYASKADPTPPAVIEQQIASLVRVANNLIASRNNGQEREMRQRMGTTLVMAVQLSQSVLPQSTLSKTSTNGTHAHELYVAHVGDSRAYWITPRYCHQLTVDDDVITREVSLGRSLYTEAIRRPDGGALTQALGTRDGELIHPTVRRFVLEEDGILLLCSDGLSDSDRVEQNWETHSRQVLRGEISLEQAVQDWIDIANQQNGHDNTSVVLMRCRVTEALDLQISEAPEAEDPATVAPIEELTPASQALIYDNLDEIPQAIEQPAPPRSINPWLLSALAVIVGVLAMAGVALWIYLNPSTPRQPDSEISPSPQTQQVPTLPSPPN